MQSSSGLRVLVTGGAIGDLPAIQQAKNMGYQVFTSGNRPSDPGHKLSNNYVEADYTNVAELSRVVRKFDIKNLIPSCHDTAYVAAAKVAKICGLPGFDDPEIAIMIHHKDRLALGIQKSGLPGIETELARDYKSATEIFKVFGERVVIKPTDMTGGRGVSFVFELPELAQAFNTAKKESLSSAVLIQRYLAGSEHGLSTIIRNQRVIFSFFDDEYRFLNRYRVAGTVSPSSISTESKKFLIDWVNRFSKHYKLVDGLVHLQFIQNTLEPKILEVCRRPPGDLYPYFVEVATGYPYIKNYINGFTGSIIENLQKMNQQENTIFRHVVMANCNGRYIGLNISSSIKSRVHQLFEFKQHGEEVSSYLTETLAVIILKVPEDERQNILLDIHNLITPIVENT
jgi:biotin carboxylase